jgi:hypothetical protein
VTDYGTLVTLIASLVVAIGGSVFSTWVAWELITIKSALARLQRDLQRER